MPIGQDLIDETRGHLQAGGREELNRLNGALTSSQTTATVEFAMGGIQRGAVLAVGMELMYVWSISGQVATVARGYLESSGAAHADDALVYVNPRFSDFRIFQALNHELRSFSSPTNGLYRIRTVELTYSASRVGYDLTSVTDLIDVLEVRWKGYTTGEWPLITNWTLARDMATTEFASGKALILHQGAGPGRTLRVRYKAPFTTLAAVADDVATVSGLPDSAMDIPPLGAAARLMAGREARRAVFDSQPESRQASDVPTGANARAAAYLFELRNRRLEEESARLHAAYPHMKRSVA